MATTNVSNDFYASFAQVMPTTQLCSFVPMTTQHDWIHSFLHRYEHFYQCFRIDGTARSVLELDYELQFLTERNYQDCDFFIGLLLCQPNDRPPAASPICFKYTSSFPKQLKQLIRGTKGSAYMQNMTMLVFGTAKGRHMITSSDSFFFEGDLTQKFGAQPLIEAQAKNEWEKLKQKNGKITEQQRSIRQDINRLRNNMNKLQKQRDLTRRKMRDCKVEAQMFASMLTTGTYQRALTDKLSNGVSESIKNVADEITDQHLAERLGKVLKQAVPTLDSFGGAADGIKKLTDNINSFFTEGGIENIGIDISLSIATIMVAPQPKIILLEVVKIILRYTPLKDKIMDVITNYILPLFSKFSLEGLKSTETICQMDSSDLHEDHWPLFMPIGAAVSCILGALIIGKVNPMKEGESALAYWGKNGRDMHGVKLGVTTALDFSYFVVTELKRFIIEKAVLPSEMNDVKSYFSGKKVDLTKFIDDVNTLTNPTLRQLNNASPETRTKISDLLDLSMRINHHMAMEKMKLTPTVSALLIRTNQLLYSYAAEFIKVDSSNINRPTPYCVWLYGDPGCGKSTFVQQLAKDLFNPKYNEVVPCVQTNLTYIRSSQDPHWNNYNNQACTIVDDIAQGRGWTTDLSDILQFMCMVGPIYWSVRMAAISDKGTPFTSSLVLCTTNTPFPRPNEVVRPEAVWRRRNALLEVTKPKDYVVGEWSMLRFRFVDPMGGSTNNTLMHGNRKLENLEYRQVLAYLIPKFKEWYEKGVSMSRDLSFTDELQMDEFFPIVAQMDAVENDDFIESDFVSNDEDLPTLDDAVETDHSTRWERIVAWAKDHRPEYSTIFKAVGIGLMVFGAYRLTKGFTGFSRKKEDWEVVALTSTVGVTSLDAANSLKRNRFLSRLEDIAEGKMYDDRLLKSKVQTKLQMSRPVVSEGCSDNQAQDLFREKLAYKNLLRIIFRRESGEVRRICALGIAGHAILLPYHIVADIDEYVDIEIHKFGSMWKYRRDLSEIKPLVYQNITYDLCILEGPVEMEACPRILKHFVDENQIDRCINIPAMLCAYDGKAVLQATNFKAISLREKIGYRSVDPNGVSTSFELHRGFEYDCNTKIGDCGAILMLLSTHLTGKIAGMHVAGTVGTGHGYSAPVTRQMLEQALSITPTVTISVKPPSTSMVDYTANQIWMDEIPEGQSLQVVGEVQKKFRRPFPNGSEIIPSPMFDIPWPHEKEFSVLRPGDTRQDKEHIGTSPMKKGIFKYQNHLNNFLQEDVDRAVLVVTAQHLHIDPIGLERRLLTEHEVINGVPLANYTRMNPNSSPGLPWVSFRPNGMKGKRFLFKELEDQTLWYSDLEVKVRNVNVKPGMMLARAYADLIDQLEAGEDIDFFCSYTNLKDELRPIVKIKTGNTRLFECLPLHFNMAVRRYFGAYIAMLNQNCTTVTPAVGVDALSPDWTKIYNQMTAIGRNTIAGDYKNWDGSLKAQILEASCDAVNYWYGDGCKNARIRKTLMRNMIKLYILADKVMLEKCVGMPSGAPITADINSIANHIQIVTALIGLARENKCLIDLTQIDSLVRIKTYGDDNLIVVSDELPWFNFSSLRDYFKKFEITYTTPEKTTGDGILYWDFGEVSFLKRKFTPHPKFPDRMLAPIDIATPNELCHWIKDDENPYEACRVNIAGAYREYHQHGSDIFRQRTGTILQSYLNRLKVNPSTDSGYDLRELQIPVADFQHFEREWISKFE